MSEERLIEITSTVSMMNGPLVVLGYLSSLSESDMYLFLKYVKTSKYKDKNFYDAVKLFSSDYLLEREVSKNTNEVLEFWYKEGNFENYFKMSGFLKGYLENYIVDDENVKTGKNGR